MPFQDAFSLQFQAFHTAIIDDCDRAARPDQTDTMALRLRNNALALTRMQLAMLAVPGTESTGPEPEAPEPPVSEPPLAEPPPLDPDRILSGDALSRFVWRPIGPNESPNDLWQDLLSADGPKRRRNPALPGAGFRSPSG